MKYRVGYDATRFVDAAVNEVVRTLFEAIALVVLVVFVFLQSWRATLIPLLAVPVSIIGTFALFPLLGFSINMTSMFGLVLAIGIVVDDAIVVVEAVQHKIDHGHESQGRHHRGDGGSVRPGGGDRADPRGGVHPGRVARRHLGRIYRQFALTIAVSVLLSAFNALTLSPALSALLLRPKRQKASVLRKPFALFNRAFGWTTDRYMFGVRSLVRRSALGAGRPGRAVSRRRRPVHVASRAASCPTRIRAWCSWPSACPTVPRRNAPWR